jgi:hypothetical protein
MPWAVRVGLSLGQAILLAGAMWSWAAFCALTIAMALSRFGYVTAARRDVWLSAASSAVLIFATTATLFISPHLDLLGIHELSISSAYIWWGWGALLACEPIVTGYKFFHYRELLVSEASRTARPARVCPRFTGLLWQLGESLLDWTTYVGRF